MIKLYNADCLSILNSEEFIKLTEKKNVVIVTDPPFNIGYHYNEYKDRMKEGDYFKWLKDIFQYPFVCIHYPESLYRLALEINKIPQKVVSWVYNSNTAKQHRDIAFFDVKPNFNQVKQPYKNPNDKRIRQRIESGKGGGETLRLVEC